MIDPEDDPFVEENEENLPAKQRPSLLNWLVSAAHDPTIDIAKFQAIMQMQKEIEEREFLREQRDAERAYNIALNEMAAEMPQIPKHGVADMGAKGSYGYAKYEDLDKLVRPVYTKHGFSLIFRTVSRPTGFVMEGVLKHRDGHQSESCEWPLAPDTGPGRNPTQSIGSANSYAKRYLTENLLNLVRVGDDDDGRTASNRPSRDVPRAPTPKQYPDNFIGKVEQQLDIAKTEQRWIKVFERACESNEASGDATITALHDIARNHERYRMPVVKEAADVAIMMARKRLSEKKEPEVRHLASTSGKQSLPYNDRSALAKDAMLMWKVCNEKEKVQFLERNAGALAWAYPDTAAKMLMEPMDEMMSDAIWAAQMAVEWTEKILKDQTWDRAEANFDKVLASEDTKTRRDRLAHTLPDLAKRLGAQLDKTKKALEQRRENPR